LRRESGAHAFDCPKQAFGGRFAAVVAARFHM
jgi:hypothetical protein